MTHFPRPAPLVAGALSLLVVTACGGISPSVATFANTTRPVTVGPVPHMGAKKTGPAGDQVEAFSLEATNFYSFNASPGGGGTSHHQEEGPTKYDVQVEKALDECRSCAVRVDSLRVGSRASVLLGVGNERHWTKAEVELHRARKGRR